MWCEDHYQEAMKWMEKQMVGFECCGIDIFERYGSERMGVVQQWENIGGRWDIWQLHDLVHDTIDICQGRVMG